MLFKMALHQFAPVFCLMIILLSKGCHSQQPACGRSLINSRIIGGENAAPGRWPWHAAIEYNGYVVCQGSLITNQWVLTSATCSVTNYLSGSTVHLGVQNRVGPNPNAENRSIEYFLCHHDYGYSSFKENDICLLKLSAPVNFTDYIQPVCLAAENSTFDDGTSSWVTGFGYNQYYYQPEILQEINVPVIGNNKCKCLYKYNIYYYYYYYQISENTMCAGSENGLNETSYGDEGAALVTKKDSVWVQSGIVSTTYQSWLNGPSVYTRVSQYQKWISDRVTGMEPGFVTFTSPGNNSDFNYTCPTPPPTTTTTTTPYTTTTRDPYTYPYIYPSTYTTPSTTPDDSLFGSGENMKSFTHFISLSVLVLFLHVFVGSAEL